MILALLRRIGCNQAKGTFNRLTGKRRRLAAEEMLSQNQLFTLSQKGRILSVLFC
jgi:hypothetical protein